jgi:hypothetical protein
MSKPAFAALVIVATTLAGCGDDSGPSSKADSAPPPAAEGRCENVSPAKVEAIASGLQLTGGGGSLRGARAVASEDFQNVYFVSAEIDGAGLEGKGDVGTWATNGIADAGGTVYAVDAIAQEFSDWPDGDKTDAEVSMGDDGAEASRDCLE